MLKGMSRSGWAMLIRWTVFGTLGCTAFALAFNWLLFHDLSRRAFERGMVSATIIPVLLAAPLFFYLTVKLRELAIVNHRLDAAASIDGLTRCLNRTAFSDLVDRRLLDKRSSSGALLIIDADHFKTINDRFGHAEGDEALKRIADAIRSATRSGDIVGRLGGEEFGVYLDGTADTALAAERIRQAVEQAPFCPEGTAYDLTVSVGARVLDRRMTFSELYREADTRLYEAKRNGRNQVVFAPGFPGARLGRQALH